MVVALRRRHPYDVFWMHGQAEAIARDTILKGTALSAPVQRGFTALTEEGRPRRAYAVLGSTLAATAAGGRAFAALMWLFAGSTTPT